VLFTTIPHALILSEVGPGVDAIAVLLVIAVLSLISPAVLPGIDTHTLHVIVEPFSLIFSAV
jgi:hypothetical protein